MGGGAFVLASERFVPFNMPLALPPRWVEGNRATKALEGMLSTGPRFHQATQPPPGSWVSGTFRR